MAALSPNSTVATVPDLWDRAVEALKEKDKQNVDFQRADKQAILVDVLREVQRKKQACINQRLRYKRSNGDSVLLYDVFGKIAKWVNTFKEVGDAAVQYDPGHAALPWAAIRFLLQVAVNDVRIFGSLVEGLEVVCKTVARYAAIERLYFRQRSSVEDLLEGSIIATYISILRFLSKCRKHFDLGLTRRVARSITQIPENSVTKHLDRITENDKKVSDLTKIIDAERSRWNGVQQLSTTQNINNLANGLQELRIESTASASKLETLLISFREPIIRTVEQASALSVSLVHSNIESREKEERLRILLWLSNIQYKKHHQSLSKGLLEGTGSWLLGKSQYIEWRNSSVSSVLWLHGIPGSGKTCLMATVIQQLLIEDSTCKNAAPIAYFYCQRNTAEPQRSDPEEVLRAVLKQLLCYNPLWQERSSTAEEYRARKLEADEDGSEISRLNIAETRDRIVEIASQMPVTILIDALDECRSDQRHQLLGALDFLLEKSSHLVKVFVSSRDDVDIVLRLQKHPNIYINIYDNKHDINRFIRAEVQRAQSDGRLLKGIVSSRLKTLITRNLSMKAEGMFLWVSLQIESLCDSRRIKIEEDLVDELARLPRSLAGMYSLILQNIGQIEQRGRTVAKTMLRWLLCTNNAKSHVTIAACSGVVSNEYRRLSIPDILDVCSTLVVYDEPLDEFRFAHLSVREFLESQPGYTQSEANRIVLERSLHALCDEPYGAPFRYYASRYWISHCHKLEEQHWKEAFELHVKRFLFSGLESSDVFKIWAIKATILNIKLPRSKSFSPSEEEAIHFYSIIQDFHGRTNNMHIVKRISGSPLDLASCYGWLEILDHFKTNQNPHEFYDLAMRMMTVAIHFGQTPVVRWLVDKDFTPTDEHLELAFHLQRSEIVQTLLDLNILSFNTLVNGQKILVLAVRFSLGDIYRDLIKKGANICCQDQTGRTLLSHAVASFSDNSEIIEDLLLRGLDPISQDSVGSTPLSVSIWGEHQPTSKLLLAGRRIKYSGKKSRQDSLRRVLQSFHYHSACLLLLYGLHSMLGDLEMRAEWMDVLTFITTLSSPQKNASNPIPRHFGKIVSDPEDRVQLVGQTLLCLAALLRHETALLVLLDRGFDPTCPAVCEVRRKTSIVARSGRPMSPHTNSNSDSNKMCDELRQAPLAWAAYTGNRHLVQSILDRGLDPNIRNRKGQTALYFAVQQTEDRYSRIDLETDKEEIVRRLLQKGALIPTDAYDGATILDYAFKARYSKVVKLLLDHGAEKSKGATDGSAVQLWSAFDQG